MNLLTGIAATSGALNAQKTRLDIIAQNIANAHTTRGPNGLLYQRQVVSFESELVRQLGGSAAPGTTGLATVRVAGISSDTTPGQRIYDPDHPDADVEGMVTMPNVNLAQEMVDLITSSRTYEANLAVVKNSRQMAMKALDIGR
ncbi:MAG TPA: flagellar basal body rod protein FlgC [Candidatus Synoicihabitans sp.]|nr:flagellar basal body rod protein FlgC [Candidatus Synoicihabitans sp.]